MVEKVKVMYWNLIGIKDLYNKSWSMHVAKEFAMPIDNGIVNRFENHLL